MRFYMLVAVLPVLVANIGIAQVVPKDWVEQEAVIRKYLSTKYDDFEDLDCGGRVVYDIAYDPNAPLTVIHVEELRSFFPHTTFARTTLQTPYHEYFHVDVIVAITADGDTYDIRSCVEPSYREVSRKFLALARNKSVMTPERARQLVLGIGQILATILDKSEVRNVHVNDRQATAELWQSGKCWRELVIYLAADNTVENLVFSKCSREKEKVPGNDPTQNGPE